MRMSEFAFNKTSDRKKHVEVINSLYALDKPEGVFPFCPIRYPADRRPSLSSIVINKYCTLGPDIFIPAEEAIFIPAEEANMHLDYYSSAVSTITG